MRFVEQGLCKQRPNSPKAENRYLFVLLSANIPLPATLHLGHNGPLPATVVLLQLQETNSKAVGNQQAALYLPAADIELQSRPPLPSPSQVCCKCGKPIGAAFLKAFDRLWHEECFTCTACHHPIRDMKYARKGLDPYHADCLALDQGDICFKCLQAIVGPVTSALGKKWHAECFTCGACKRPITEKAFTAVGDVPYHAACEPPRSVTPPAPGTEEVCAGCQRPIVGGVTTTALGKVWHADCFVCCLCGRPIREDKFKTDNGKPQHINCKLGDTEVVCFGCKRPITTGDIINALGEVWHADCFKCHLCGIRIMGEKFAREGDRPVHPHCKLMAASEA